MKPEIVFQQDFDQKDILLKEKEVYGIYLSNHPTTMYKKNNPYAIPINEVENHFDKQVDTLLLVDKMKLVNTKKGDKMAFITGSDESGQIEYILFPKVLNKVPNIDKGNILKIRGRVEKRLNRYQIIVDRVKNLEEDNEED